MALIPSTQFDKPWFLAVFTIICMLQLFLAAGPIFGFSSLLVVFKRMKFYNNLCDVGRNVTRNESVVINNNTETCDEQDAALNLLFVIGWVANSAVKFGIGVIVDKIGAQVSQYFSCVFMMLFGFVLAYAKQGSEYLVIIAFLLLSIGSSTALLTCYQVMNVISKKNKAILICILSGAVDSSTAVFILFLAMFETGLTLSAISMGYGCFMVVFMITSTIIFFPTNYDLSVIIDDHVRQLLSPKSTDKDLLKFSKDLTASFQGGVTSSYSAYKHSIQKTLFQMSLDDRNNDLSLSLSRSMGFSYSQSDIYSSIESVDKRARYGVIKENVIGFGQDEYHLSKPASEYGEVTPLVSSVEKQFMNNTDVTLLQCLFSKLNFLCILMISIIMLKLAYFIGNIDKYFLNITSGNEATTYIKYFGIMQFLGIFFGPIVGLLFMRDRFSCKKDIEVQIKTEADKRFDDLRSLILPILTTIFVAHLMNGLQLFQQLSLSFPLFLMYLLTNGLMWCCVSYFYALLFPPQHYCSLYGCNMVFAGLSSFVQYPILSFEQSYFGGEQFWMNLLFLGLLMIPLSLPAYMKYYCWRHDRCSKLSVESNYTQKL